MVRIILLFLLLSFCIAQADDAPQWSIEAKLSSENAWQRQQVILSVEATTTDEFARLETQALDLSDFEVIELPYTALKSETEKNKRTIKVGWILFPLVAGRYEIELPKMYYRPSSGQRKKLKLPVKILNVKALPSYVPPTMPVGKVVIENNLDSGKLGRLHTTKTLTNWNIKVITNGVLPQTIPPVLRQIKMNGINDALEVLPETTKKNAIKTFTGFENTMHYQLPIKALKSGRLSLPELSIQYFDPQDNMLKKANSQPPTHWALNHYLQLLLAMFVLMIGLLALFKAYKKISAVMQKQQNIRHAKNKIQQAKNITELRNALKHYAQANGWQENSTLEKWLKNWQAQNGENNKMTSALEHLLSLQFEEGSGYDIDEIKSSLLKSL